jgi:hypothetical protein
MKLSADRPFADPEEAARKLIEIATTVEAVQDRLIYIERVNGPFLKAGGNPAEYRPASNSQSAAAGCWDMNPAPTSSSPRQAPRCLLYWSAGERPQRGLWGAPGPPLQASRGIGTGSDEPTLPMPFGPSPKTTPARRARWGRFR